jgi:hypothetical protein
MRGGRLGGRGRSDDRGYAVFWEDGGILVSRYRG